MDRWLFSFFSGAILSLFMPVVPVFFCVVLCIFCSVVCLMHKYTKILSGMFIGAAWIIACGTYYNNIWLENNTDISAVVQNPYLVSGTIQSIPASTPISNNYSHKFNFSVDKLDGQTLPKPFLVRLSWSKSLVQLNQGERWDLYVKLKQPYGFANEGGFSYQTWLRKNNLVATGYVRKSELNQKNRSTISFRQSLYNQVVDLLPNEHLSPLLLALSFGERNQLTVEHWQVLQNTNTQHLIAISGLHLGLIAAGSFWFFRVLLRYVPLFRFSGRIQEKYLVCNVRLIAVLLSCACALYYAFLAGFSLPTLRALVMLYVFWFIRLAGVRWSSVRWVLVSLFIVILVSPLSLISASFWLSFYAVSLIFLSVWRFKHTFKGGSQFITWIRSLVGIQLILSVLMLPISMVFNYQVSIASFLANIVAVPVMSFTTIPLCLMASISASVNESLANLLFNVGLFCLEAVWLWLEFLSNQTWASYSVSWFVIAVSSVLLFCIAWGIFVSSNTKYVVLISSVVAICFSFIQYRDKNTTWKMTVFDVGQGLSLLIQKEGKAILYDTGANYPSGFNMVDAVVFPYLKHQGITQLDMVILSHSDNDHAGGLDRLKELVTVNYVVANDPKFKAENTCFKGEEFIWLALTFSVLSPIKSSQSMNDAFVNQGDDNDDSCVIAISDGENRVLLTGDISKKIEAQLVKENHYLNNLTSDVVLAPHHGSKTSSSEEFIKAVSPKYVVYSAGYKNRWNMPSQLVQQRYLQHQVKAFNTATQGAIEFEFTVTNRENIGNENSAPTIEVKTFRENKWPFWFAN